MNYKRLLLILLFLTCCLTAKANYVFDARCLEAYHAILDLRLDDARTLIREEKQQNPQNGVTILLDNYVDYFGLVISEDRSVYDKLKDVKNDRIDALEKNEEGSPYYLFAQAEVDIQWALLKGKFGDFLSSSRDLKKARGLLEDNQQKYPDFLPNEKGLALINVIFGALPSNLKGIARFLGMKGNTEAGVAQMEKLRTQIIGTKYSFYNDEIIFYLCYMDIDVLHNKNHYAKLMGYVDGMDNKSLLKAYFQGYVAAKTAHNDAAIDYLEAMPKSNQYLSLPITDYLLGCAKLCRMDSDAYIFLLRYISAYKGENLIKDAYLKVAYYYLLKNDEAKYNYYLKLVRSKGYTIDERDQQALKEANDIRPDIDLLKARLYYDGGYFNKALVQLADKQVNDFKLLRDKIEFNYRLGRIYEGLDRYNDAIASYQKAINLGKSTSYYFAANAALSIGSIYEHIQDYNMAANYYNQALAMKDHEYKSSIDSQAKDGLERMHKD